MSIYMKYFLILALFVNIVQAYLTLTGLLQGKVQ